MDNLQVKKQINNKLKLYRKGLICKGTLISGGYIGMLVGYSLLFDQFFGNNISFVSSFFRTGGYYTLFSLNYYLLMHSYSNYDTSDEVKLLKQIKRELKNGINRFENISDEDFDIEFAKSKKKYIENKVK